MKILNKKRLNFIVVGSTKSGTTSLYYSLKKHPEIYLPPKKEMNFFNNDSGYFKKGRKYPNKKAKNYSETIDRPISLSDYLEFYPENSLISGDITPTYLMNYKETIKNIKKHCDDDIKIIIILRNPIDQVFSSFNHQIREDMETTTFYQALLLEEERMNNNFSKKYSYKRNAMYFNQVKAFKDSFKNIKVYLFDEVFTKDNTFSDFFIDDLYSFLGVKDVKKRFNLQLNKTGKQNYFIISFLIKILSSSKKVSSFFKTLGFKEYYMKLKSFNTVKAKIDNKSKKYLMAYFRNEILSIEKLINKKLSHWL